MAPVYDDALARRLNVGCGRNIRRGWINLDSAALPGVDIVCDLDQMRRAPIPLPDDSVAEFLLSHVIEHLRDPLALMQELWRRGRCTRACNRSATGCAR